MYIRNTPKTPSLFTLERARKQKEIDNKQGDTHRLDDPFSPAPKWEKREHVPIKGEAVHGAPFNQFYQQNRTLLTKFIPSISTMKGGHAASEDWFKPKLIENWYNKPKKKEDEDEDDLTPN